MTPAFSSWPSELEPIEEQHSSSSRQLCVWSLCAKMEVYDMGSISLSLKGGGGLDDLCRLMLN